MLSYLNIMCKSALRKYFLYFKIFGAGLVMVLVVVANYEVWFGDGKLKLSAMLMSPEWCGVTRDVTLKKHPVKNDFLHVTDFPLLIDSNCRAKTNSSLDIIIFVHTRAANMERRQLIRKTWASIQQQDGLHMRTVFVIGRDVTTPDVQEKILADARQHGDVIQFDFVDSYRNLTLKHLGGLRWVLRHCNSDVRTIVKLDDDVWVNMTALVEFTHTVTQEELERSVWCMVNNNAPVFRQGSKWAVSEEDFQNDTYPPYCMGAAILYSPYNARKFLQAAQTEKFFWIDDVFVSGILRQKSNVTISELKPPYGLRFQTYLQPNGTTYFTGSFLWERGSLVSWSNFTRYDLGRNVTIETDKIA